MVVDILSDIHIDFYFRDEDMTPESMETFFNKIILNNGAQEAGDLLIIAGDLGHYNQQNIKMIQFLKNNYYKDIICVLGNHDYYLVNNEQKDIYGNNSFNRTDEMRALINKHDNLHCLDGSIVEINGIKFGGCDSWYSSAYLHLNPSFIEASEESINRLWRSANNDSRHIYGIKQFDDIYNIQIKKIEQVYRECDIMITHVNPSCLNKHISPQYRDQDTNTFFTFNGERFMILGSMKYWIFGHTHDPLEYEFHGVKCICNPLAYPNEREIHSGVQVKKITV